MDRVTGEFNVFLVLEAISRLSQAHCIVKNVLNSGDRKAGSTVCSLLTVTTELILYILAVEYSFRMNVHVYYRVYLFQCFFH